MSIRHNALIAGLIAALLHSGAATQNDPAQLLVDQGVYWQERGDAARAEEAWQKLLRLDGQHPRALLGLGMVALMNQRPDQARLYVDQLRQASQPTLAARLEQEIALRTGQGPERLEQARQAAQAGDVQAAVSEYREVFGSVQPQGNVGVEYYQTLAATPDGWTTAREGLERLLQQDASNTRAALALAQLLTYREDTRRDGIARLASLAQQPDTQDEATTAWRTALLWLGDPPPAADAARLQAFLQRYPDDAEVAERLAAIRQGQARAQAEARNPVTLATNAAFKALESGDLATAEAEFQRLLERQPNNGNALGGLGIIRLRQQNFAEAQTLLRQAARQGGAARWREPLNEATYWTLVNQAEAARATGNLETAEKLLQSAVKTKPRDLTAAIALANVQAESGQLDPAESALRTLLRNHPGNPDVIQGLVGVLAQNGKTDEALRLIQQLPEADQNALGLVAKLQASRALGLARAAKEHGDTASQRAALEEALSYQPNDPWIRLELAQVYTQLGAGAEARGIVDGLLVSNPQLPDALFASALIAAETGDPAGALQRLEQIPPEQRSPEMQALQRRAWVTVQARTATQLAQQGRRQEAVALLAQTEAQAANDVNLLGAVAEAYVAAGDVPRSLAMMRTLLGRTAKPDPALLLTYAGILSQTGQDVELAGVLRQLQAAPLSPTDQVNFQNIRANYIIRQADTLRQMGNLPGAYDMLAPVLAERPNDPDAIGALARMYADAGDSEQALTLFQQLLQRQPNDVPTLIGAANMATQAKAWREAEWAVDSALALQPNNPDALQAAAQLYRAQGKRAKAVEYLERALAAQGGTAPGRAATAAGANPFLDRAVPPPVTITPYPGQPVAPLLPAPGYIPAPAAPLPAAGQPAPWPVPGALPLTPYPGQSATIAPLAQADAAVASPRPAMAQGWAPAPPAQQPYIPSPVTPLPAAAPAPAPTDNPWFTPRTSAPVLPGRQPAAVVPALAAPGLAPAGAYAAPGQVARSSASPLQQELQRLREERSGSAVAGVRFGMREGESGLSELTSVQMPLEAKLPLGDGKVALRVTPVTLDAGSVSNAYTNSSRFGGGPAAALAQADGRVGSAGSQSDTGVGVALAYVGDVVELDIGSTPLGMQQTNVVGGFKLKGDSGNFTYSANVSRRAVTDSLLSFAGAQDRRTGQTWGGVTASGARLDLGFNEGNWGVYGSAAWHALQGKNVVDNTRVEGGFGVYGKLINDDDRELTVGLNFTGIGYDKNLRYFTYGHGGYFSPQSFFAVNVPVTWSQRAGRLTYSVNGSLGVQSFKENTARYFPGSDALQLQAQLAGAEAVAQGLTSDGSAMYQGQSKTGLGYSLAAAMEYQVSPQLFLGGGLAADNARDYREWTGGVYMRYMFEPVRSAPALPLAPYRSPYTP